VADAIFISYRRDDSEGEAGRLFDDLTRSFGSEAVFMDVAGIKPGVDFRKAIEQNVASCGVLLAIIGPNWLTMANADGKRRLDDPNDFVALEIASAMRREVPVIPVLVHDAKMPPADQLPESIKDLAFHNSVELSHARWNSDVALLIEALKAYVTPAVARPADPQAPVHATVPVQLPAPHPSTATMPVQPAKSSNTVFVGLAIAAVVVLAAGIFMVTKAKSPGGTATPSSSVPVSTPPAIAAPALSPSVKTVTPTPSGSPYSGTWKRSGGAGSGDALGLLVISGSGNGLTIHAYGGCQIPACDWGMQPAATEGTNIAAAFSPSPGGSDISRTAKLTISVVPQGLDVLVQNTFEGPAGTRHNGGHLLFVNAK